MQLSLCSNISRLRKERAMTQEQLAEALGVTFASVSKWERGVATPELSLIARMADLFGVSLDALVGFQMQSGTAQALEKRIHTLQQQKKYEEATAEAEKALLRYPNDFKIVYRSGELYAVAGIERSEKKYLQRCISLLERAMLLLSQNTDPQLGEVTIQCQIAQCYLVLGETKKGIEILKKYNVSGVHNALIAIALTGNDITYTETSGLSPEDAVPFMVDAFDSVLTTAIRTMMAYANYFHKKGDYASAYDALVWLIDLCESVKVDKNAPCYLDKVLAPSCCECAKLSLMLGREDEAQRYMRRAYRFAVKYDASPTRSLENLRFQIGNAENAEMYDDLGETATSAVLAQITRENGDRRLYEIWEKIASEKMEGI